MSGFNARHALPADERPPAFNPGVEAVEAAAATPTPGCLHPSSTGMGGAPAELNPRAPLTPPTLHGATIESAQLGEALAAASAAYAEMEAARAVCALTLQRNAAQRLCAALNRPDVAALSRHLARSLAGGR